MRTLLVLASHPGLSQAVLGAVSPNEYRIINRSSLGEAEPLLTHGLADACILDVDFTAQQGLWVLENVRRRAPKCPVIVYSGTAQWEWEEEAYLQGANMVLTKPVRERMLVALLDRLWITPTVVTPPAHSTDRAASAGRFAWGIKVLSPEAKHAIKNFFYALVLFGLAIGLTFVPDLCLRTNRPTWLVAGIEVVSIWLFLMDGIVLCGMSSIFALRAVIYFVDGPKKINRAQRIAA
jgi:CheY-like chemotaxis protein